jgi:hypothetical protein
VWRAERAPPCDSRARASAAAATTVARHHSHRRRCFHLSRLCRHHRWWRPSPPAAASRAYTCNRSPSVVSAHAYMHTIGTQTTRTRMATASAAAAAAATAWAVPAQRCRRTTLSPYLRRAPRLTTPTRPAGS